MRHITDVDINLLHPDDHPPPHGVKMLLYMHPGGTLAIGQWQHSGAALWAPLPRVGSDMKARLDHEQRAKRMLEVPNFELTGTRLRVSERNKV